MLKDRKPRKVVTHRLAYGRPASGGRKFPEKLDHWEITSSSPDKDGSFPVDKDAMARLADEEALGRRYHPTKPRRLPIRLDSDSIEDVLMQRYECRVKIDGRLQVFCHGDGETAKRLRRDGTHEEIRCCASPRFEDRGYEDRTPRQLADILSRQEKHNPNDGLRCPYAQNRDAKKGPKCSVVSELIARCDVVSAIGGRARFRSHSHRTADQLVSSLEDIKASMPGGILQHVPLDLVMQMQTMQVPDSTATAKQPVAHVELRLPFDKTLELMQLRLQQHMALSEQVQESRLLLEAAKEEEHELVDAEWQDAAVIDDVPGSGPFKGVGDGTDDTDAADEGTAGDEPVAEQGHPRGGDHGGLDGGGDGGGEADEG